jgi:hypothetical protein
VKADTTSTFSPVNINTVLWATGRKAEARKYVAENLTRCMPSTQGLIVAKARLASADLYVDSAATILEQGLSGELHGDSPARATLHVHLAAAERTRGRISVALRHQDSVRILNPSADAVGKVPASALYRANVLAWDLESPAEARRLLDSIAAAYPPGSAGPLGYRWLGLAQAFARAGDLQKAHTFFRALKAKPAKARSDAIANNSSSHVARSRSLRNGTPMPSPHFARPMSDSARRARSRRLRAPMTSLETPTVLSPCSSVT